VAECVQMATRGIGASFDAALHIVKHTTLQMPCSCNMYPAWRYRIGQLPEHPFGQAAAPPPLQGGRPVRQLRTRRGAGHEGPRPALGVAQHVLHLRR
jgi:hypothetical protein